MNKRIIIISIGAFVAIIIGVVISRSSSSSPKSQSPVKNESSLKSAASENLKEYTDPAGFSFSYPASVSISQKNTTNNSIYSSLEATSSSTLGKITLEAVSSDALSLKDLVKSKTGITNVKLADLDAQQYTEKGDIITLALDEGVLFTIIVSPENNTRFWKEVNNNILSSFVFALPEVAQEDSSATSSSTDSDVSFEGEETIE